MKIRVSFSFLCLGLVATLAYSNPARAAVTFQGLGDLGGGTFYSSPAGVSEDGSVVAGTSNGNFGLPSIFRWTQADGIGTFGVSVGGTATGVSGDGNTIVGYNTGGTQDIGFVWTQSTGKQLFDSFPTADYYASRAYDISSDGSTIVGQGSTLAGHEAYIWTQSDGTWIANGIDDLAGGSFDSRAYGTSVDGSVVVGGGSSASGIEAFLWTSGGGMVGLGDLPGGSFSSTAYNVSADGSVVVGSSIGSFGTTEAFRWSSGTGMVGLGDIAGGGTASWAYNTSADGSTIVGMGSGASGYEAFIWDDTNGMQSFRDHLISLGVTNLTGWTLTSAEAISADGLTIVGYGTNPSGYTEGWIATVPEPSTALLLGAGLLGLAARRRKVS